MPWSAPSRIETWWRGSRWVLGRLAILVASFLCGLGAFLAGVGLSERPGVPDASLMAKVYYTLGLFVMGGVDYGVPDGGPQAARALLWVAYFLSPMLTAVAIAEGFLRAINPDWFHVRRVRNHIVIAGCGELALLYLSRLREVDAARPVFIVEADGENPRLEVVRRRFRARVLVADIRGETLLDLVNLRRAAKVFLFTGDDLANLEACARILRSWPRLGNRIVVHVSDIHLMRVVSESGAFSGAELFNSHHIAASHLVHTRLAPLFRQTPDRDRIVLAGFGRFGQTVLAEIERCLRGTFEHVLIVDLEAEQRMRIFTELHALDPDSRHEIVQGNMEDPYVWQRVRESLGSSGTPPVFVLGSDQDGTNLRLALWLKSRFPEAHIVVRTFHHSTVADQVARHCSFEVESVADLVRGSMRDEWFDVKQAHAASEEGYEAVDRRTGVYTRRHFLTVARREWNRATSSNVPLSAIVVEIDGFDAIARARGREASEQVFQAVARFLQENVRGGDSVGLAPANRLSILLPGGSEKCVRATAERLDRLFRERPIAMADCPEPVSLRFGWAVNGADCSGCEALLARAEAALGAGDRIL